MEHKKIKYITDKWDKEHTWYAWRMLGEKDWKIAQSLDGSRPKTAIKGWFTSSSDVYKWIQENYRYENEELESQENDEVPNDILDDFNTLTPEQKMIIVNKIYAFKKENTPEPTKIEKLATDYYKENFNKVLLEGGLPDFKDGCNALMSYLIWNSPKKHKDYLEKVSDEFGFKSWRYNIDKNLDL
jgi:hypothetical protein